MKKKSNEIDKEGFMLGEEFHYSTSTYFFFFFLFLATNLPNFKMVTLNQKNDAFLSQNVL